MSEIPIRSAAPCRVSIVGSHGRREARYPTFDVPGTTSRNRSRRLPQISSPPSVLTPVILPPGLAKLSTMPKRTGSP